MSNQSDEEIKYLLDIINDKKQIKNPLEAIREDFLKRKKLNFTSRTGKRNPRPRW